MKRRPGERDDDESEKVDRSPACCRQCGKGCVVRRLQNGGLTQLGKESCDCGSSEYRLLDE